MVAKNDVTGDTIRTKSGNQKAYADGWERIFGKKVPREEKTRSISTCKNKRDSKCG